MSFLVKDYKFEFPSIILIGQNPEKNELGTPFSYIYIYALLKYFFHMTLFPRDHKSPYYYNVSVFWDTYIPQISSPLVDMLYTASDTKYPIYKTKNNNNWANQTEGSHRRREKRGRNESTWFMSREYSIRF